MRALWALALLALSGAAQAQPAALTCQAPQQSWMVADLLFGRSRVPDVQWRRFLAAEITPRFPDGLTIFEARGQWRSPGGGRIARERSTVVTIAFPPGPESDARLQQVVQAYKTRFRQQSVGLILRPACVAF